MTLFHKNLPSIDSSISTKNSSFIGRTCSTQPIALEYIDGAYEFEGQNYIYFYTNFQEEHVQFSAELLVYEIIDEQNILRTTAFSPGWFLLDLALDNEYRTAYLNEATPRILLEDEPLASIVEINV